MKINIQLFISEKQKYFVQSVKTKLEFHSIEIIIK